jgi:hypothetical protein
MTNLDELLDAYPEQEFLKADGYDDCVIGLYEDRLVYSMTKMVRETMLVADIDEREARDFLESNIWNGYVGELTPVFVDDLALLDIYSLI